MEYRFDGGETWWPWLRTDAEPVSPSIACLSDVLVATKESTCLLNWLHEAIVAGLPIIIVGDGSVGKTTTIRHFLNDLPKEKYLFNVLNLASNMRPQQVQELVMAKLDRRRKGVFGPPVGKSCIIFADDLAVPLRDQYGAQPPLELLRQWITHRNWSDLKDTSKIELVDLVIEFNKVYFCTNQLSTDLIPRAQLFIGAMNAIGGRNFICPRLYRHAFIVAIDAIELATAQRIFTSLSEWHFARGYSDKIAMLTKSVALALCALHDQLLATLRPTPSKFHYLFSLRDVWRVFQGICLVPPKKLTNQEKLIRLWAHETYRVYSDRFTSADDNDRLLKTMNDTCKDSFKVDLVKAMGRRVSAPAACVTNDVMRALVFGNFMEPDAEQKNYDEIDDWTKLEKCVQYYLNEYNAQMAVPLDLVLFRFCIEHISRISRALQLPQGHCLIVGQSGSGRRSAIRLAVSMAGAKLFELHAATVDWRENVKKALIAAGTSGKMTVVLYTCASNANDNDLPFLDDIVTIMNCCELPNLFQSDERAKIIDTMQSAAKESVSAALHRTISV